MNTNGSYLSVASSNISRIQHETASLLLNISANDIVPNTFRSDVCANNLVDSCAFSTFAIDITGLNTR